jgi:transcription antitermination factor NusG
MRQIATSVNWYVIYTRPKFEKSICSDIEFMNKEGRRYESYLPVRQVIRRWSDRMKKIEEPLFNCYVFVQTESKYRSELLQIPGVVRFISSEGRPTSIPSEEIERIRRIESGPGDIEHEPYYVTGDRVMVTNGVFAGMEGMLIKKVNNGPRFLIRLPLLRQAVSIEIAAEDMLKIA